MVYLMALRYFINQGSTKKVLKTPYFPIFQRSFCKEMTENVNTVDFENLNSKMKSGVILVDVREPTELKDDGKIPNSINIPLGQVSEAFRMSDSLFLAKYGIPKPKEEFIISCRSGKRATDAFQKLKALGYKNALVYSGSFQDWVKNGGITEK